MTIENSVYGPGWKTCVECGITAADVVAKPGAEPRCPDAQRCRHVVRKESLGAPVWAGRPPQVPELTTQDHEEIAAAIVGFTNRRLEREAEARELAQSAFRIAE